MLKNYYILGYSLKCFEGNSTGAGETRVFKTKEVECEAGVTKCYKLQEGKIEYLQPWYL